MPLTFSVNANNDLFIGVDGNIAMSEDLDAVLFTCENAVKAQLGEMFLQVDRGLPNFEILWVGNPNFVIFEGILRQALETVPGVEQVVSLDINRENDVFSYRAVILTQYGQGVINGGL